MGFALVSGKGGIWTQAVWLQSQCSSPLLYATSWHYGVRNKRGSVLLGFPSLNFSLQGARSLAESSLATVEQFSLLIRCFILLPAFCFPPGSISNKLCFKERNRKRQSVAPRFETARFLWAGENNWAIVRSNRTSWGGSCGPCSLVLF